MPCVLCVWVQLLEDKKPTFWVNVFGSLIFVDTKYKEQKRYSVWQLNIFSHHVHSSMQLVYRALYQRPPERGCQFKE